MSATRLADLIPNSLHWKWIVLQPIGLLGPLDSKWVTMLSVEYNTESVIVDID